LLAEQVLTTEKCKPVGIDVEAVTVATNVPNSSGSGGGNKRKYGPMNLFVDVKKKKRRIEIFVDPHDIHEGIIEVHTVNSLPFTTVESSGFQKAFGPILSAVPDLPVRKYNRRNIREAIFKKSKETDECIKRIVRNRLLNLKLDCATSSERSFIGVNLQFRHKLKLFLITLGLLEIEPEQRHTAAHLRDIVVSLMKDFNVDLDQILSVTSDNGSNVVKCVKKINEFNKVACEDEEDGDAQPGCIKKTTFFPFRL